MKKYLLFTVALISVTLANAQSKVAHVNSQEIMAAMPSYNQAVHKLNAFQDEIDVEMQTMAADYQTELDKYIKERDDLSPVMRQVREDKLAKKQQAYEERQQTAQLEIEAYSRELNEPIVANIQEAIEIVAKNNNCDYIFDVSVVMISNGSDLTQEAIKEVRILDSKTNPPPKEDVKP